LRKLGSVFDLNQKARTFNGKKAALPCHVVDLFFCIPSSVVIGLILLLRFFEQLRGKKDEIEKRKEKNNGRTRLASFAERIWQFEEPMSL
jgi:hypothetical protein